jgi:N-acetylglucosamine-6-phosphate deacetylase
VLPGEVVSGKALVIEGNRITGVRHAADLSTDVEIVQVDGRLITPGLLDIHIHGALGRSFNEPQPDAFAAIVTHAASCGIASLLATIATASIPDLVRCLECARDWIDGTQSGAQVLGVHLEGPYFSQVQRGAQDPAHIRLPDDGSPEALLAYHRILRIMSFAPELPGALNLASRLAAFGVVPAAGHSSASDEEVRLAMQRGLRHCIHIWSGQSSTTRRGPWRVPGLLEATLVFEGLTAEMIADNRHLPPTLMRLAYNCLGPDRLCVISDATSGAGLPEGARFHMGGMEYAVHDGVGMLLDRTAFAGSTTMLNRMIPILRDVVGIPLAEAVRMASLTPARVIGMDDRKGSLESGKLADVSIFEDDFTCWRTMIGGHWAFVRDRKPV